jgi:hypothetical protein
MTVTPPPRPARVLVACLLAACGDDKGTSASATGTTTGVTTLTPTTTMQPTTDGSAGGTTGTGGGTGTGTGTTTTGGAASSGSATEAVKFDLGGQPDQPPIGGCGGGGGMGMPEFSYIWIANSVEGTVSKIDTFTGVEVGRYVTGPDTSGLGDANNGPSRTSVNLYGDAAVANRNGGVTKIAARLEDCPDTNGNGVADTSTGPLDVKAWGQDECVLWHHPTPTNPLAYQ